MLMWIDEDNGEVSPHKKTKKDIIGIKIDDKVYVPGGDGILYVDMIALKGFKFKDLPVNVVIVPAEQLPVRLYIKATTLAGRYFLTAKV